MSTSSNKITRSLIVFALTLWGMTNVSSALVLLTDNFDVNPPGTPNTGDYNYGLYGPFLPRQTGLLANTLYTGSGNVQVGNNTGPLQNGNYLLTAFGATVSPNQNFIGQTGAETISFDMAVNVGANGDHSVWSALSLGMNLADRLSAVNGGGDPQHFGILFRGNGGLQTFENGVDISSAGTGVTIWDGGTGTSNHTTDLHHFDVILSDLGGLATPFGASGNKIQIYADNNLIHTYTTLGGGGLSTTLINNFINFQGLSISGTDNLRITALQVPEPSTMLLLGIGSGLLLKLRRKTRKA